MKVDKPINNNRIKINKSWIFDLTNYKRTSIIAVVRRTAIIK
jgi:hypothetical protein